MSGTDQPPPTTKVCINYLGGYKNQMTFVLAGLDVEEKAKLAEETLWKLVGGRERFAETSVRLVRSDRQDPLTNDDAFAYLQVAVKDPDAGLSAPKAMPLSEALRDYQHVVERAVLGERVLPADKEFLKRYLEALRRGAAPP